MENENKNVEAKEEVKVEKKNRPVLNYLITTLNGMAYGLFATLIIGTILGTIGTLFHYGEGNSFCDFMFNIIGNGGAQTGGVSYVLQILTGAGIGVGIALVLKLNPLQTIVLAGVGELAGYFSLTTKFVTNGAYANAFKIGDPLTIYLVCIAVALAIKFVIRKKTPVDILIVPLFGITVGTIVSLLIRYPAIYVTYGMQWLVNEGTNAVPFVMGIVVAVLMGMALTAPISSAAIGAMIFIGQMSNADGSLTGLAIASGAACIGCCCQMVGIAIQSRKDNPVGMVISVAIGTSMLQFKNILKKPIIWLPTIIASAILGPISTCWVHLVCMGSSAGMGTSGLVGQIGTIASMGSTWQAWVGILALEIIAPAALVFGIDLLFRKLGWIKEGDFKI
jgi:uncharacterized membrane protein